MSKSSELKSYLRQVVLDNCTRIIATYFPLDLSDFLDSVKQSSVSADDISDIVSVLYHAVRDHADELKKSGKGSDEAENMTTIDILENPLFRLMIDSASIEAIMDCDFFEDYYSDDDDDDSEVLMA